MTVDHHRKKVFYHWSLYRSSFGITLEYIDTTYRYAALGEWRSRNTNSKYKLLPEDKSVVQIEFELNTLELRVGEVDADVIETLTDYIKNRQGFPRGIASPGQS